MSDTKNKGTFQPDSDVHISFEDQQKINKFANYNAKLEDYKDELKVVQNEMKNLEEAADEIELFDADTQIPFLIGEVFISSDLSKTQELLAQTKEQKQKEIKDIKAKCNEIQELMADLKGHLYSRFGSHIFLENEEE